ncbi:ABC transporter substrate-binding protein [uncultured Desulfosarcina sp.]|uniref:ABC transporter substrate-binding protein n=1 Tax=uncultured Desulfosarcina sp. TaxID=218289 RepID=UPI0029C8AB29|nr:ABC transporter substrate-binding protein [uncultured Desulfosarcina sp.]
MFSKQSWILTIMVFLMSLLPLSASAVDPLRIGTWKTPQTIQPFFYDRFLPPSIKSQILPFTNPADQKTALLAGSLDMCGTTLAHAIYSASVDQPVVVVAALCNKCSALVVKKDGPIHSEKDLAGKTIGYVPGTMHEILLRETLTRNHLSPATDVTLIRVDFFDMGTALAGGSIDAFLSGEPFPTLAAKQGYGRILAYPYFPDSIGTINAGMLVRRSSIENEPQKVFQLVLAHARATRFLETHHDTWLGRASGFGTPMAVLTAAEPNMELAWEMDDAFVQRARALGDRMQALGIIHRQPDYDRLFDLSFVKRAKENLP